MILWIIVAIVLIGGLIYIKLSSTRDQIKLVFVVILALFLFGTILIVYTTNKLDLNNSEGILNSVKLYLGLLGNGFQNLKAIAGNVIGLDWTSTNGTFFNKTELEQVRK